MIHNHFYKECIDIYGQVAPLRGYSNGSYRTALCMNPFVRQKRDRCLLLGLLLCFLLLLPVFIMGGPREGMTG